MKTMMLLALLALVGCSAPANPTATASPVATAVSGTTAYTCSMHPEVVSDKPGKCPKCNMDLIVKK